MLGCHVKRNHQGHHLVTDEQCRALRKKKCHILRMIPAGLLFDFSLGRSRLNNDSFFFVMGSDRGVDHCSNHSVTKF